MENKDFSREFGNRCRQIRMAKGMSQQELADKMHTTPQNVSKWEREGISSVNTVMELSEVLGQDITSDQMDQEGSVGEVGKEILIILVKSGGYIDYDHLKAGLFGLSDERIAAEIFKLERIGTVVREQYKDYLSHDRDGIFITAKGIITGKHMDDIKGPFHTEHFVENCTSYESRLEEGEINLQEQIDKDEISRLLWTVPFGGAYRIDYLRYLKDGYRVMFPQWKDDDEDIKHIDPDYFMGENCFIDILYRMAFGYGNVYYDPDSYISRMYGDDEEIEKELEEERIARNTFIEFTTGLDEKTIRAQKRFSELLPWVNAIDPLSLIDGSKLESPDAQEMYAEMMIDAESDREIKEQPSRESMIDRYRDIFFSNISVENKNNCARWFTRDQIIEWVDNNYVNFPFGLH